MRDLRGGSMVGQPEDNDVLDGDTVEELAEVKVRNNVQVAVREMRRGAENGLEDRIRETNRGKGYHPSI